MTSPPPLPDQFAHPMLSLRPATSTAIRMARVLCILSMTSVHVWPGATQVMLDDSWARAFYEAAVYYLGRGSVPLLSTISGVLLVVSAERYRGITLLQRKVNTLLYPMCLWSALLLALYGIYSIVSWDFTRLPATPVGWLNAFLAVTAPPANEPLAFLRDAFVSIAIGLGGISIFRRSRVGGILFLAGAAIAELATGGSLLLRPQILTFFTIGVVAQLTGRANVVPPLLLVFSAVVLDVLIRDTIGGGVASSFNRVAMSIFIWRCAVELARSQTRLGFAVLTLEPSIFLVFCSHMIVVTLVAALAGMAGIEPTSAWVPAIWLVQFPLIAATGLALHRLGRRAGILGLLTGGRA